jgi:alpha-mannosidase II
MYEVNSFTDTEDHGPWTQGFPIEYKTTEWDDVPLKIWVIPHSHNDPGWIKTVDEYFNKQTRNILDLMVDALAADPSRTFIWAETSYFAMWWDTASDSRKATVKRLLDRKQLEIVAGGWVMPDEANSHYFALIDQLVEGHQWLENNLGVKPSIGWSIDPFGHSPTMAYINKRAGMPAMVIQRIHFEVKRMLAEQKNLEFMWRQDWDRGHETDIFTQMMPFYSYDVPHTCGPNPKICCQFDFARFVIAFC